MVTSMLYVIIWEPGSVHHGRQSIQYSWSVLVEYKLQFSSLKEETSD